MDGLLATARDTRRRSLVKTGLYRVLMLLVTIVVALVVTGRIDQALSIGIAANVLKTLTYYGYERAWARVGWGLPA